MVSMISGCEFRPAPDPFVTNRIPTFAEQQICLADRVRANELNLDCAYGDNYIAGPDRSNDLEVEPRDRIASADNQTPELRILGKYSRDATGFIEGVVSDNTGVAELLINDRPVSFDNSGRFNHQEYLPSGGKEFTFIVIDRAGLRTLETIRLSREASPQVAKISFNSLNPTFRLAMDNSDAIALIVGVAQYEKTSSAEFADRDAQVFYISSQ